MLCRPSPSFSSHPEGKSGPTQHRQCALFPLTSVAGMVCLLPRGASKKNCSLALVLTWSSFPELTKKNPTHIHHCVQTGTSFGETAKHFKECIFTPLVPVQMGDVIETSFANSNPLAAHNIVNIHKRVCRCDCEVLADTWANKRHERVCSALATDPLR